MEVYNKEANIMNPEWNNLINKMLEWNNLINKMLDGNIRAIARLITNVENRIIGWQDAMKIIYSKAGRAIVIGITGSPGAGKSSLTNRIALMLREKGLKIGIIAVDPSSPFSGGALLGDRLRMKDIFSDKNIFIRSMATRGALGGLCQAAKDVVRILDASGKDVIIIETVGVGQDEIEIVRAADFVMLVLVPGQGDGIQAIKAGVMEIADLYVVNKSDRDGADEVVNDITSMLEMSGRSSTQKTKIIKTSVINNTGFEDLIDIFIKINKTPIEKKQYYFDKIKEEIFTLLEIEIVRYIKNKWEEDEKLDLAIQSIIEKQNDPYSLVEKMIGVLN
jgi:LAO/AO transport system kinase